MASLLRLFTGILDLKTMTLRFRWMVCFVLVSLNVVGQTPFFRNYTIEDGLPSSRVFHVLQDTKGVLWMATNKGVGRFNGNRFDKLTAKDGLPGNMVFYMARDPNGGYGL